MPATLTQLLRRRNSRKNVELCLDTDFGVDGLQAQAWFNARYAEGYRGFITTGHTFWDGTPAVWADANTAFDRARAAGMWIGIYWRSINYWGECLDAISATNLANMKFFILDVETETGGPFPVTEDIITAVEAYGAEAVIYSIGADWNTIMDSSTAFSAHPLFDRQIIVGANPNAMSDGDPDAYGGWNVAGNYRKIWQSDNTVELGGVTVDRDYVDKTWIDSLTTREVNLMTDGSHGTFEKASTGWSAISSAISLSTTQAHTGLTSLRVITSNAQATEGALSNITVSPSTEYTFSFWVYGPAVTYRIAWDENDSGAGYITTKSTTLAVSLNTWTQVTLTATTESNAASLNLYMNPTVQGAHTFYIDDVTLRAT